MTRLHGKERSLEAIQTIALPDSALAFEEPRPGVHLARLPIAGCGWVDTDDGVVLIDTLIGPAPARTVLERIHRDGERVRYIIYTHGHLDHVGGAEVFMQDRPVEVIGSQYLPDRLDGYKRLAAHRARIAAQQFNLSEEALLAGSREASRRWVYPTRTFLGEMTLHHGGKTFELHGERAETDDAVWVWVPELRTAFVGDLIIGSFPNIGNPWKPTRFALDWARALERVRAKEPELVLGNGAGLAYPGRAATEVLDHTIAAIRSLHDQVVERINEDVHITEMIHRVKLPAELADSPHLQFLYSRPEFFVFNVYRWYHGYFDHNPAHLLPRPQREVAAEIFDLIGDPPSVLDRARELQARGQAQLGLQVLDVLIQAHPEHIEARRVRVELLEELGAEDRCLMSRNAWVYFIDRDLEFIRSRSGQGDP